MLDRGLQRIHNKARIFVDLVMMINQDLNANPNRPGTDHNPQRKLLMASSRIKDE